MCRGRVLLGANHIDWLKVVVIIEARWLGTSSLIQAAISIRRLPFREKICYFDDPKSRRSEAPELRPHFGPEKPG